MTHVDKDSWEQADEHERRRRAEELSATLEEVEMDFGGSGGAWRYGGGRDLSRLAEKARERRAED